jgi:CRISPR-associated protein Csb2
MPESLCISVTFLDPRFHGRGDGGANEWPPSPMRLFQALVAGSGTQLSHDVDIDRALRWLETQPPPTILAPPSRIGTVCPLYVPNNAMDLVAAGWVRGNSDESIAEHRALKTVRPTHLRDGDTVHYLWPIADGASESPPVAALQCAVERMVALGWGIDLVVAQCRVLPADVPLGVTLEQWAPAEGHATNSLRCPIRGSLDALTARHAATLDRLKDNTFHPVPAFTAYRLIGYRRPTDAAVRPHAVFELVKADGGMASYPQRDLIHVAGMMRHLAKEAMTQFPPADVGADWVKAYVAGHGGPGEESHRRFSYVPLPSIGHRHVDPAVRRVMIVAPLGDDRHVEHLARRLNGATLQPEPGSNHVGEAPTLIRVKNDRVARYFLDASSTWASVTPVILSGHDDHKPAKTRALIEKALRHAGVDLPCDFEWSSFSRFPKSLSAHKYGKDERPAGYRRPKHLEGLTAVHLVLRFADSVAVPGPLTIGAGRHCGLGLMANLTASAAGSPS